MNKKPFIKVKIEKMATQRSVAEKTETFSIVGLLKDKGVYENRGLFLFSLPLFWPVRHLGVRS